MVAVVYTAVINLDTAGRTFRSLGDGQGLISNQSLANSPNMTSVDGLCTLNGNVV